MLCLKKHPVNIPTPTKKRKPACDPPTHVNKLIISHGKIELFCFDLEINYRN